MMQADSSNSERSEEREHRHRRRCEHRQDFGPEHAGAPEGCRHHPGRDFWGDWREERHHGRRGDEIPMGQPLSPKEMEAWRDFFHQTFGTWPEDHWVFGGRRFSPWHQGLDSFNPFVATLLSKGGGLLPIYVLELIAQRARYGNEIMDRLAERTHGQWVSNPGAIYPLLNLLEREGFIQGEWEDPTRRTVRLYTITPRGQAEVARMKTIVMPKLAETVAVLQEFLGDLQGPVEPGGASAPAEPSPTGEQPA